MNLDCNTERGQLYTAKQAQIAERFADIKKCGVVMTKVTGDAVVDAIFFRDYIEVVAEVKAREMSMRDLRRFGSYLITFEKLIKGRKMAKMLRAQFLVIAGLSCGHIVHWRICDPAGDWKTNFDVRYTITQATCNGGTAERANAYLSLRQAKIIEPDPELPLYGRNTEERSVAAH